MKKILEELEKMFNGTEGIDKYVSVLENAQIIKL